jgi:8-oxo-dGTP pyrophosphatase MutT (NUDIX family)
MVEVVLPKLGAGVVVLDESGRVLLVHEGYGLRRWGLPGGATESGEDVRATAMREAKEETGLDVALDEMVGEYRISYGDGSDDLHVSIFMARGWRCPAACPG